MKKISFFSIMLLLMFVIGCQNQNDLTETTDSSNTPINTTLPNITLTPTKNPALVPTASPTQTLSIQFPEWVKNPNTQILLIPVGTRETGYENMALYNAETGERFDVPFTEAVGDYFWMPDGSFFGFLPKDESQVILFSIKEGFASIISLSKETLKFFYRYSDVNPVQVTSSNITDSNLLIIPSQYALSPDKKYFEYKENYDQQYTSVFDISKNQIIGISDPNDEYIDLYSEWSPTSSLLAIVEVDEVPEMWNTFKVLPTFRLRVYDVHSRQVVASYKNVTFPKWSPDGRKFLFQEWKKGVPDDSWYGYAGSPPCIYNTIDGTTNCYYEALTDNVSQFSSVDWSPDQSKISYVFSSQGFCTIILATTETQCILGNLELKSQNILNYLWSPNSNFISFVYDSVGPYSDTSDNPKIGIANFKTGEYFSIGEGVSFYGLGLWRPSPIP